MRKRCFLLLALSSFSLFAADWPMWRCDAGRSGMTPADLPAALKLNWTLKLPPLEGAWQDVVNQDRMPFDRQYEPVIVGHSLFVVSSHNNSISAYDTRSGKRKWRVFADAPLRFAPVVAKGKLFVAGDDGCLRVLDAASGREERVVDGGSDRRLVLGNRRLVSAWTARGGPVVANDIVYFGAGIWPFMGTFLQAINIADGSLFWRNGTSGHLYMNQPHGGSESFGGVAPQGALAVGGEKLIVPSGRSVPAIFSATNGALLKYNLAGSPIHQLEGVMPRKLEGGSTVCANRNFYLNQRGLATALYDINSAGGYLLWRGLFHPVLTEKELYLGGATLRKFSLDQLVEEEYGSSRVIKVKDEKTNRMVKKKIPIKRKRWRLDPDWELPIPVKGDLVVCGSKLYAAEGGTIRIVDLALTPPAKIGELQVPGTIARLVAGDDRLFAVTLEGGIHAFGAEMATAGVVDESRSSRLAGGAGKELPAGILSHLPLQQGWCVVYGVRDTGRIEALLESTKLQIIGICDVQADLPALRSRLDDAGQYGSRVSLFPAAAGRNLPRYLSILSIVETPAAVDFKRIYESLRPYGGVAYFARQAPAQIQRLAEGNKITQYRVEASGEGTLFVRPGALPGSADWSHLYGDPGNTAKSDDQLVRAPLGLLWFGNSTHRDVLPRHAHGPSELVVGGRLFIQGVDVISARDVYTGIVLWRREFPKLNTSGVYYDQTYKSDPLDTSYNQVHIPGANQRGTNMVAATDRLYLLEDGNCLGLDPATGETVETFQLPLGKGNEKIEWVYLAVSGDKLVAGGEFARFRSMLDPNKKLVQMEDYDASSCRELFVFNRKTKKLLWRRPARLAFRHNAICASADTLFCLDAYPPSILRVLARRGRAPKISPNLLALDLETGNLRWSEEKIVFGTWLSYSKEHQVLLQCGRPSRDMVLGEMGDRMALFRAANGELLWDRRIVHGGPVMLHGDTVFFSASGRTAGAIELMTGNPFVQPHPITGRKWQWSYHRRYGCNAVIASEYLLTFRSGAAGFCDIEGFSGTGNFGGFKSGCTSNLIVANGVLNAPDYTRTCTCSYQNQTSLALVPMPDLEYWMANEIPFDADETVKTLGLNLGAAGDRRDEDGLLWFDYPSTGGPSPKLPVTVLPENAVVRRRPVMDFPGAENWISSSGVEGVRQLKVQLSPPPSKYKHIFIPVSQSSDDAEERGDGSIYMNSSDLELTKDGENQQVVGIRFGKLPVGTGDKIISARIVFTAKAASTAPTKLQIGIQDTDSAGSFSSRKKDISSRALLAAKVDWEPNPWEKANEATGEQTTPELASLLRAIVARPDWKAGNAVCFVVRGDGNRCAWSVDRKKEAAPRLELLFEAARKTLPPPIPCQVTLFFAEDNARPGERVFDVKLQGRTVLSGFDASVEAPLPRATIAKSFVCTAVQGRLLLDLVPVAGSAKQPLLRGMKIVVKDEKKEE